MEILREIINKKNDKLEPLSVIIKLFIYAYKPLGTKLAIHNNCLLIQENGLFQGPVRSLYGDSKNDINIIYFPIIYACTKYLTLNNNLRYINLFKKLNITFEKLIETYKSNDIIYNIEQLKNIITSFIDNPCLDPNSLLNTYESEVGLIKRDIYSHLSKVWTERRLNVVFGYIDDIIELSINGSTPLELIDNLVNSLHTYIQFIDMLIYKTINALK